MKHLPLMRRYWCQLGTSRGSCEQKVHCNVQWVRRGTSRWSKDGLLRLDDFYSLARQLALGGNSKDHLDDPDNLSSPERLLCDLICAASPSLYDLVQNEDNEWCLKMVDFQGNRIQELRRVLWKTQLQVSKRDRVLQTIRDHRSSQTPPSAALKSESDFVKSSPQGDTSVDKTQKVILEPYIRPDMTLEDRVRARAEAREERDAASKAPAAKQDFSSLLRLADAMWSHSRHILRRQSQVARMPASPLCITVQDVVRLFAGSLRPPQREKATRTEMLQALRDLERLVPEWISFSTQDLNKHTTVWLLPTADYASVRTKLGALSNKRPMESKASATSKELVTTPRMVSISPDKKHVPPSDSSLPVTKKQRTVDAKEQSSLKRPAPELSSPRPKKKKGLRINKHLILTDADYEGGTILQPGIDESPRGLKRLFIQMNSGQRI